MAVKRIASFDYTFLDRELGHPTVVRLKPVRSLKGRLIQCYGLTSPEWKVAPRHSKKRAGRFAFGGGFTSRHRKPNPRCDRLGEQVFTTSPVNYRTRCCFCHVKTKT
jgi:hypothetical protein